MQCTAKSKQSGEQCRRLASKGQNVCYIHGGRGSGRPPIHARYSRDLANNPAVLERYERHKRDPQLGETLNEIALQRALVGYLVEAKRDELDDEKTAVLIRDTLDSITRMVERRHKIRHGEQITITVRHMDALVARVLDLVRTMYGEDDRYRDFCTELGRVYRAAGAGEGTGSLAEAE